MNKALAIALGVGTIAPLASCVYGPVTVTDINEETSITEDSTPKKEVTETSIPVAVYGPAPSDDITKSE